MGRPTIPCNGCEKPIESWRQCPDNACHKDIGYCSKCGGDSRAIEEMKTHIKEHLDFTCKAR